MPRPSLIFCRRCDSSRACAWISVLYFLYKQEEERFGALLDVYNRNICCKSCTVCCCILWVHDGLCRGGVINCVCLMVRDASSPRPGGTFAFLRAALALQLGALDLRLQQRHTAHQLLQLSAGSVRPVRLPTLVLIQTAVSCGHLKRPVHLTGSDRSQQKTRPYPNDYVAA